MDEMPLILDPAVEEGAARLAAIRTTDALWRKDDRFAVQLRDLIDVRTPGVDLTADEPDSRVQSGLPASRSGS